jgi:hypothetical protein
MDTESPMKLQRKPVPPQGDRADTVQAVADDFADKLTSGVAVIHVP